MAYNGMDERVMLTRGGSTTRFIHDPDGRIIGEYTTSPTTPIAEYIWLLPETGDAAATGGDDGANGWHPLAVSTANGAGGPATLLWLHSNHLGTPAAFAADLKKQGAASLRIAGGYATQPLASPAQPRDNDERTLIATG